MAGLWALALIAVMLIPGANLPEVSVKIWDKLIHFICYAVFSFLLLKGFYISSRIKNYFLLTAVISIGYGTVLELFQSLVPDRGVDIYDIAANTLGCIAAMIIFPYLGK